MCCHCLQLCRCPRRGILGCQPLARLLPWFLGAFLLLVLLLVAHAAGCPAPAAGTARRAPSLPPPRRGLPPAPPGPAADFHQPRQCCRTECRPRRGLQRAGSAWRPGGAGWQVGLGACVHPAGDGSVGPKFRPSPNAPAVKKWFKLSEMVVKNRATGAKASVPNPTPMPTEAWPKGVANGRRAAGRCGACGPPAGPRLPTLIRSCIKNTILAAAGEAVVVGGAADFRWRQRCPPLL